MNIPKVVDERFVASMGGITDSYIAKTTVNQSDIDHAIAEHEARVTKSGFLLVLVHDLLFLVIILIAIKFII